MEATQPRLHTLVPSIGEARLVDTHQIVRRVHNAFAAPRGAAGEAQNSDVLAVVELHPGLSVGGDIDGIPEAHHALARLGRVHHDDCAAAAVERLVVLVELRCFEEHGLGLDMINLRQVLLGGVAKVGVGAGRLLLENHQVMEQAQVVVVQDEGDVVAFAYSKRRAHHVGDAVGEQVKFAEAVAAVALDVHQRQAVSVVLAMLPQ